MSKIIATFAFTTITGFHISFAQSLNRSGIIEAKQHSVGLSTGLDYSILLIQLNYKYGFKAFEYKYPFNLGLNIGIPLFQFDITDHRVKVTSEALLWRKSQFEVRGGIDPLLVSVSMKTERMVSIGADFHVFAGYTNSDWNIGVDVVYNKIVSTHINHTDIYRKNVYEQAVDGWYKNTAANLRIGVFVNRSVGRFNAYLNGGISKTGQFKNYLFVPTMYFLVGTNYIL